MSAGWITAVATLGLVLGTLLTWCGRRARRVWHRVRDFLDDWSGQPEREGVPARPGVMARLLAMEHGVAEVRAETQPNGGTSLRDVVHRTASDVADVKAKQEAMRQRMELFESQRQERAGHD